MFSFLSCAVFNKNVFIVEIQTPVVSRETSQQRCKGMIWEI
jgi:hypothetical protein